MMHKSRFLSLLSLLVLVAMIAGACQPVHAELVPVSRSAADIANEMMGIRESVVIDGVGQSKVSDPAQAQAENEFLAAAIAKEHAFYAGDVERYISYYADNAISVQPGTPEIDGRAVLADGMVPYVTDNNIVGKLTIKRIWVMATTPLAKRSGKRWCNPRLAVKPNTISGATPLTGTRSTANGRSSPSTSTTSSLRPRCTRPPPRTTARG